jgi:hypothetical protein
VANYPNSMPSATPTNHGVVLAELRAIAAELGLNPKGVSASVAARLNALTGVVQQIADDAQATLTALVAAAEAAETDAEAAATQVATDAATATAEAAQAHTDAQAAADAQAATETLAADIAAAQYVTATIPGVHLVFEGDQLVSIEAA